MTLRQFRPVASIKAPHGKLVRPDRSKGTRFLGSPWLANTRSSSPLNSHSPHPSSSSPFPVQSTSSTLRLSGHNTQFESLLSPLTNHLGLAPIYISRRASQTEISMCTNYIRTPASTTTRHHSGRREQRRSFKSPTATPCLSRSQRTLHSPCTMPLMRRYKLSTFSHHSHQSPHLLLC
jgi:hypothetical protein